MYELDTDSFTEHDIRGKFLKVKEPEQNSKGNIFLLPYIDDGFFKVLIFTKFSRLAEIDVNELLKIDNSTLPMIGIPDPLITACFVSDSQVYVSLIHRASK